MCRRELQQEGWIRCETNSFGLRSKGPGGALSTEDPNLPRGGLLEEARLWDLGFRGSSIHGEPAACGAGLCL